MKFAIPFCVAAFISFLACAAAPDDAHAFRGTWIPAKAELAGQPISDAALKTITLKLDDGKYEVMVGDQPDKGTYTFNSLDKPKSMTVTGTEGPNKGKTFPCIYELEGDTLRICYDLSGRQRPTEFKTTRGTRLYLVKYRRKKG